MRPGGIFVDVAPPAGAALSMALDVPISHPTFLDDTVLPVLADS